MFIIMTEMGVDPVFEYIVKPMFSICPKWMSHWIFYRCAQGFYFAYSFTAAVELYGTIFFIVLNLSCLYFWLRVEFSVVDSKDGNKNHKGKLQIGLNYTNYHFK